MKVTRIHYTGGLSQDRFLENCGGRRKPTLLRVKALMSEQVPQIQTRIFGLVLENENENEESVAEAVREARVDFQQPHLVLVQGGLKVKNEE